MTGISTCMYVFLHLIRSIPMTEELSQTATRDLKVLLFATISNHLRCTPLHLLHRGTRFGQIGDIKDRQHQYSSFNPQSTAPCLSAHNRHS